MADFRGFRACENAGYETFVPKRICVSMKQGKYICDEIMVSVGETVYKGQMLGRDSNGRATPVFAGIGGVVKDIFTENISFRDKVTYIKIQAQDTENVLTGAVFNPAFAGIVSMLRPYESFVGQIIEKRPTIIALAAFDREPGVYSDFRLLMEFPGKILFGALAVACHYSVQCLEIYVCREEIFYILEKTYQTYKKSLDTFKEIRFYKFKDTMYEKSCGIFKRNPQKVWCTAMELAAFYDSVYDHKPMTARGISVAGCVVRCKNLWVPNGTYVKDIIEHCGGLLCPEPGGAMIIEGGLLGGHCVPLENACVSLTTEAILAKAPEYFEEEMCIGCRACVNICPVRLNPRAIERAFDERSAYLEKLSPSACIECGWCSYVCPAKRRLKEKAVAAKKMSVQAENDKKALFSRNQEGAVDKKSVSVVDKSMFRHKKRDVEMAEELGVYIELPAHLGEKLQPLVPVSQSGPFIHDKANFHTMGKQLLISGLLLLAVYNFAYGIIEAASAVCAAGVMAVCLFLSGEDLKKIPTKSALSGLYLTLLMPPHLPVRWIAAGAVIVYIAAEKLSFRSGRTAVRPTGKMALSSLGAASVFVIWGCYFGGISMSSGASVMIAAWALLWLFFLYKGLVCVWPSAFFILIFQWIYFMGNGALSLSPSLFAAAVLLINDYHFCGKDSAAKRFLSIAAGVIGGCLSFILPVPVGVFTGIFASNIIACILGDDTI